MTKRDICTECGEPGCDTFELGEPWHSRCFQIFKREYEAIRRAEPDPTLDAYNERINQDFEDLVDDAIGG